MLTYTSFMHPRTLWNIEAAMRELISRPPCSVSGYSHFEPISDFRYYATYKPGSIGAFMFFEMLSGKDITPIVLKALRASTKGE